MNRISIANKLYLLVMLVEDRTEGEGKAGRVLQSVITAWTKT